MIALRAGNGAVVRRILCLALIAVLAASAAPAPAHAPTREAYIAKVDPICQKTDRKLSPIGKDFSAALERHQHQRAARLLDELVHVYARSLKRVARVEPPAEDAQLISRWLDFEMRDVRVTRHMVAALEAREFARYNRYVEKSRALEHRINGTIGGYGFKHCNEL